MFRKAKTLSQFGIIAIILLGGAVCTQAMGLGVRPDSITLRDVPLGEKIAVSGLTGRPYGIQITNKGAAAYSYVINIHTPAQVSIKPSFGYEDIPDTAWIQPKQKEIRIEAGSSKDVELYIDIPGDSIYAGKRYQAIIEVQSKKNHEKDIFVLAAQVRVNIHTRLNAEQ
jgi:hypothetical protein